MSEERSQCLARRGMSSGEDGDRGSSDEQEGANHTPSIDEGARTTCSWDHSVIDKYRLHLVPRTMSIATAADGSFAAGCRRLERQGPSIQ